MIVFILNNDIIKSEVPAGTTLLDFIRYDSGLPGTKVGCREGDCGACTVLEGSLIDGKMVYKSIVSCLTPIGNAHGKHIVTIEGINMNELSPVQHALVENSGTQCGFCTPGFVMSLTCHCMEESQSDKQKAIDSISGNICRCTGYKSIERAAESISALMQDKNVVDPIKWLVNKRYIPEYFLNIPGNLKSLHLKYEQKEQGNTIIGGGTDLMVQKPEQIAASNLMLISQNEDLKGIFIDGDKCVIKSATSANMIMNSSIIQNIIPDIKTFFKLISSEPIRNTGTIAGNIVNASPIADLSIFFLVLNAELSIVNKSSKRTIFLRDFFLGYKKLDLSPGEIIKSISFKIPEKDFRFNFEKVSKRTYLDIASVNSAIYLRDSNGVIEECAISAGGVSPIPLYLKKTGEFLVNKTISNENLLKAAELLQQEISPISDIRGSEEYKRLLARQLFFAHFIKLFPEKVSIKELINNEA